MLVQAFRKPARSCTFRACSAGFRLFVDFSLRFRGRIEEKRRPSTFRLGQQAIGWRLGVDTTELTNHPAIDTEQLQVIPALATERREQANMENYQKLEKVGEGE